MEIESTQYENVQVFRLTGRLDEDGAATLQEAFEAIVPRGITRCILDFAGVEYISSIGVRALLLGTKQLQEAGGKAMLAGLNPSLVQFFQMSGLSTIFTIHSSVEEALDANQPPGHVGGE